MHHKNNNCFIVFYQTRSPSLEKVSGILSSCCHPVNVTEVSHPWVCRLSSCHWLERVSFFWAAARNDSILEIKAIDSVHTVSLCFIESCFHQLLYLSRKVRSPDLGGLWYWLYGQDALCAQDSQMRELFFIIKSWNYIWFCLSIGIFSVVDHSASAVFLSGLLVFEQYSYVHLVAKS